MSRKRGMPLTDEGDATVAAPAAPVARNQRREDMADIARRRAAHFANFDEGGDAGDDNVHVGSNEARTLGPWSSAVELVNARQEAAEQRNRALLAEARQGGDGSTDDVSWEPTRDVGLGPRATCAVAPLLTLSLQLLASHIDAVESLVGMPDAVRSQLAAAVCARRSMSPASALMFAQGHPTELVLPSCVQLDAAAMSALIAQLLPDSHDGNSAAGQPRLERLELGHCGRGFGDEAATQLASAGPLVGLRLLRLGGAYRLGDAAAAAVVGACPDLVELALPSAPRLTGELLSALPNAAPRLASLDLCDCRGLPGPALTKLLAHLPSLQRLKLDGVPEVDAKVLAAAGASCTQLSCLSVAMCPRVDDAALVALVAGPGPPTGGRCAALEGVVLDDCAAITDTGLAALAAAAPQLKRLSVRRCTRLSDNALASIASRGTLSGLAVSGVPSVGRCTLDALTAACGDVLAELDVSFCRSVPEGALGALLDRAWRLRSVRVYGCTQLSPRAAYGHCNDGLGELTGLPTSVTAAGAC